MARFKDHEKALALRKQKMSYSQIKKILKVSKSTLSLWLRDYPLPEERIRELRDWNEKRIERYRETKRKKKEKRLKEFYSQQKKVIFPFNRRELFLTGLFLYWGEGGKTIPTNLSMSNTDPSIIKFFIMWLNKSLNIPKKKLKVHLHLYNDMNIDEKTKYWSNILQIPIKQFTRPYIKKTSSKRINHKGTFGHGTCNIRIGGARLAERIHMSIKAVADKYQ